MIRKTLIGLAAVAAVTAAAASTASAGYYGYTGYYGGYNTYAPVCHKVIVGYKTIWNGYAWIQVPRFKRVCNYY